MHERSSAPTWHRDVNISIKAAKGSKYYLDFSPILGNSIDHTASGRMYIDAR